MIFFLNWIFIDVFATINLNNNNQFLLLLSGNKITKNYTTVSIFIILVSSLTLSLFMFYMPISYSQIESDEALGGEQQTCAEGEVLNADTQICEPSTEGGTEGGEGTEQQTCPEGEVLNADTQMCEPSTRGKKEENNRTTNMSRR